MLRHIGRQLLTAFATVVVTAVATFVMIRLAPGDPLDILLGEHATDAQMAAARQAFGLDRPIWEQLGVYVWKALFLDFGRSIVQGIPVADLVLSRLPATLYLAVATMLLIVAVAVPLGIYTAVKSGGMADRVTSGSAFVALSLPDFWVGIVLILIFARTLHLLPSSGAGSPAALIMPAITLALPLAAVNVRLMRNEALNVLRAPYVTLARARGIPESAIIRRHVLRNAIIPVLTIGGVQFGHLLGGAAIVETVFGWPGVGQLLIRSIASRDYPVAQGCIMLMTVMVVGINFSVDVAYRLIDPRFRTS
jgi:ABC-type dipeptide/oligopeptide/nickel transport system permease component